MAGEAAAPGLAARVVLHWPGTVTASAERRTQIKEEFMSLSDQLNALQKQAEDLKSFADQARHETNEEIKARVAKARADITARQDAIKRRVSGRR
jgi:peptidoglycan hydrolase CwlO-like protein